MRKENIFGLYAVLVVGVVSSLPERFWLPKVIVTAAVALAYVLWTSIKKPAVAAPKDTDWFRRTVEETMHVAIDLGFNPTVSQNEKGNGTAVFHADPEGNMIKLIDVEVPAPGSSEADFMTIIETNREKLTEIAKKFGEAQKEKKDAEA